MKCPNCNETLTMSERNGIEIDYCPECRGIWLDRGELDKIIERSSQHIPQESGNRNEKYFDKQHGHGHRRKKKDSFLSDLFDF